MTRPRGTRGTGRGRGALVTTEPTGPCAFCNTTDPAPGWTGRALAEPVTFRGTFGTVAILPAGTWAVCAVCSTWLDGDHWDHALPVPVVELLDTVARAAQLHPTTEAALRRELVGQARHLAAAFHPVTTEEN